MMPPEIPRQYTLPVSRPDWPMLLADWQPLIPQGASLWLLTKFGDLFFAQPDGKVGMLQVTGFQYAVVAKDQTDFREWQFYATARSNRESARMDVVFTQLSSKLDTHKQAAGQYPDSLAVLSFTNLAEVQMLGDVRKIIYQRTASGYTLSYTGFAGYQKSYDFSDTRTPH